MIYTIFDHSDTIPPPEINNVWAVLLFGDKVYITSSFGLIFVVYGDFPHHDADNKFAVYPLFREQIEKNVSWQVFEATIKEIKTLRKKKGKNALEMKVLGQHEVWLRKHEKWFLKMMEDYLAVNHYVEIVPLTLRHEENMDPDVKMFIATNEWEADEESAAVSHLIKPVVEALPQAGNVIVLDERIEQFAEIVQLTAGSLPSDFFEKRNSSSIPGDGKVVICAEKIIEVPVCYTLKSNEIKLVRQELIPGFHDYHVQLQNLATKLANTGSVEEVAGIINGGVEAIRLMQPKLQQLIDTNAYVIKALNERPDSEKVTVHLAFTHHKGILTLLRKMDMLNEESYLQACDLVEKEVNLEQLRPFIFIKKI